MNNLSKEEGRTAPMTLQECKDQVARKHHWDNWAEIRYTGMDEGMFELLLNEAAELYASQFKSPSPVQTEEEGKRTFTIEQMKRCWDCAKDIDRSKFLDFETWLKCQVFSRKEEVGEREGWIDVNERLPELFLSVLVYDPMDTQQFWVDYWNGKTWGECNNEPPTVIAWQPLPPPPRKGSVLGEKEKT